MGTYVAARPPRSASQEARQEIEAEVRALARHAFAYGLTSDDVHKLLGKLWREETKS
jgi:hypothetical protein